MVLDKVWQVGGLFLFSNTVWLCNDMIIMSLKRFAFRFFHILLLALLFCWQFNLNKKKKTG